MCKPILLLLFVLGAMEAAAGNISGIVTDEKGNPLPFASIIVKGTQRGVAANSQGRYSLQMDPGSYTLVCQYIGYQWQQKSIRVGNDDLVIDFRLSVQELSMEEVVVKKGDDPALEIMRQAIRRREYHNSRIDSMSVDVYLKSMIRSRGIPDRIFGQKVEIDEGDGIDSAGRGILSLSESVTRLFYKRPDKFRYEVLSSRESGGGYGFTIPLIVNFYVNNVRVFTENLNPRGFISPLADNAFHYYRFRFEGSFFEDDRMVSRIAVTPRRKNEPLFQGFINIVEDEWRIHSLELLTTREYSLEMLDTLKFSQIHAHVGEDIFRAKHQVVYLSFNFFGFDLTGNFLNIYSNYDVNPVFEKGTFGRILLKYDTAFRRRDSVYWNEVRPVPLEPDEKADFVFKDSVQKTRTDSLSFSGYDSLRKRREVVTVRGLLWSGGMQKSFRSGNRYAQYKMKPLLKQIEYNTVEGISVKLHQELTLFPRKGGKRFELHSFSRYGISNRHFNSYAELRIKPWFDNHRNRYFSLSGGKRLIQFNHDEPIDRISNSLYTLLAHRNYMKMYENWFGRMEYNNWFENGLRLNISAVYEDRIPVQNSILFSLANKPDSSMLPNHPWELAHIPFEKHQALSAGISIRYQPGLTYIQYPHYKSPVNSKYPVFGLDFTRGIPLAGSDVDYDKWRFSIQDDMNLRLAGIFRYRFIAGGFISSRRVELPDMQHFNGNQTFYNFKYLNSFQLAPYYRYSNTEKLYSVLHAEHHFNGLLTNKIPLFNRLKWNLVAGSNILYVNRDNYYAEVFAGLENILKLFRVDIVTAYQAAPGNSFGVRIGFGGLLSNAVRLTAN